MKSILEKLKLVDYLTTEIPIDKTEFVEKLRLNVDKGDTSILLSPFEVFDSSTKEYKGTVTFDSFKIRKRRKLFDMNLTQAVAEGRFIQKENILIIESTINGFRGMFIPFIALLFVFYVVAFTSLTFSDTQENVRWIFIPFLLIHASMMLGIPYFIMRRSVSRMKYDLERDLYYLTK